MTGPHKNGFPGLAVAVDEVDGLFNNSRIDGTVRCQTAHGITQYCKTHK